MDGKLYLIKAEQVCVKASQKIKEAKGRTEEVLPCRAQVSLNSESHSKNSKCFTLSVKASINIAKKNLDTISDI